MILITFRQSLALGQYQTADINSCYLHKKIVQQIR